MLFSLLKKLLFPDKARNPENDLDDLPFLGDEELQRRITSKSEKRQLRYRDWPAFVHLETIAMCNAACGFCPYPTMDRKGERMPDALIEKVIADLGDIPADVPFQFAPYKVSEPFLEPRLFDILKTVNTKLPNAHISLISNGTALTDRKIEQLLEVRNLVYLNISLNSVDPDEYQAVMQLPFERTLRRLQALHERKLSGEIKFPVNLTRVSGNKRDDALYIAWILEHFPAFKPVVVRRNDWIGDVPGDSPVDEVPDAPCHRWFDISITATGKVALCCMDGNVKYPKGDVNDHHVLEIYNQPHLKRLREELVSRRQAGDPCNRCTYLSY